MNENHDSYYNLVQRIEDLFAEMDSAITMALPETDEKYSALRQEIRQLRKDYPMIDKVLEGDGESGGAISISADEHAALVQHRVLTFQMEDIERQQIYFRGHTDCLAYLKRIGAI